ncbi:MAG: hypothetical protein O9328_19735 [Rhodobacteraceae bacterium]|nr:hypothetical protein [Paracoccaceae bacterium]
MDRLVIAGLVRRALAQYLPPGERLRVAVQGGPIAPLHVAVDLPGAAALDGGAILALARSLRVRAARREGAVLPILTLRLIESCKEKGHRHPKQRCPVRAVGSDVAP